ncbi:outer membrane beta-barrel protein [Rufibacter ruber]|uniref:outer membrane beta-barrel protein n=1 Tax=Rufibacter ruber TaxID=1783499 RepID=UPI000833802B|nr:outer membrane beta-barrel protein [Rufibacter ruber]
MKKLLLPCLLLLLFPSAFAQRNFKPGYILQRQDTVRGLVDQRGDRRSAAKVVFKRSPEAAAEIYSPTEIEGYGLQAGYHFETKRLGTGDTARSHFFTVLVKGDASLYLFRDADSKDHFYLQQNDSLRELVAYKAVEMVQGKRVSVPYNLFRGTLQEAFSHCPALAARAKPLQFREKELIKYMSDYNSQCGTPPGQSYVAQPKKTVSSWGVLMGATHTTLKVEASSVRPRYNQTFTSFQPTASLFYQLTLPWLNYKLALQFELQYQPHKYAKTVTESEPAVRYDYDILLEFHYLKLPLVLRYSFPVGKLTPFVNVGFANAYAVSVQDETEMTRTLIHQSSSTTEQAPYLKDYRKYAQSYLAGVGLILPAWPKHQITLEARYEGGNGFSEYMGILTKTQQISVAVGFAF